jgi:putative restriction endonuclease
MVDADADTQMRMAAFEHVRRLGEIHDHLTGAELKPGFVFGGDRIPLVNPQRGIFKPVQMRYLLSIKTVFPKPGGKVWYDDQREVHRQIFDGDEGFSWLRAPSISSPPTSTPSCPRGSGADRPGWPRR